MKEDKEMKKGHLILTIMLIIVMGLAAISCGPKENGKPSEPGQESSNGTESTSQSCSVGIVVKSLDNDYYTTLRNGAEKRAKEKGVDLTFVAPNSETDVQGQVDMIANLIAAKVDVLAVCPSDDEATLPVIQEAGEAGIPVIAVDNDTSYDKKLTFIGTGNFEAALEGGKYCAEQVGKGAKAIMLRGPEGSSNHDQRRDGYIEALTKGGVEILEIKDCACDASTAMSAIEDFSTFYDDIDLIICTNDTMAIGAQRAVETGNLDTLVFGFDGSLDVCKGTAEGKFLGTVAQDPYSMGVIAIDAALDIVAGKKIEERIDSGCTVVTKENAQSFIDLLEEQSK
ncbi:MAG: sugar ABC transporter substrate-binding protein [Clostridiaceae bacterium]|nr:sugar ABC transporter substrate-binding protein [Clostridiaceae bacterium]